MKLKLTEKLRREHLTHDQWEALANFFSLSLRLRKKYGLGRDGLEPCGS